MVKLFSVMPKAIIAIAISPGIEKTSKVFFSKSLQVGDHTWAHS